MAYQISCHRTENSIFGGATAWLKENGKIYKTESVHDVMRKATVLNREAGPNVYYMPKEIKDNAQSPAG